jgi:WD40 repeat protein
MILVGGCGEDEGVTKPPKVDIEKWKNVTLVSTYEFKQEFDKLAFSLNEPFLALTTHKGETFSVSVDVLKVPTLETVMEINNKIVIPSTRIVDDEYPNAVFLPNQQVLVADDFIAGEEKTYIIYKIPTKEIVKKINLDIFVEAATTYEGKTILLGNKERLYYPESMTLFKDFAVSTIDGEILIHLPSFYPNSLRVSHGGRYYVARDDSREVRIWEVPDKLIQSFKPKYGESSCDVSFDGKYVATLGGAEPGWVTVWETRTTQEVLKYPVENDYRSDPFHVDFSPDGKLLAVASDEDNLVRILSIPDGSTVTIIEHDDVERCFFSGDGKYLITVDCYKNIKVWGPK